MLLRYIHNYDIISQAGAFYFMIPGLFVFLFMQSEIVREKEYKLRQGTISLIKASTSSEPVTRPTGQAGSLSPCSIHFWPPFSQESQDWPSISISSA